MDMTEITYALEDITDQMRVHMMSSPLDDIIENCVAQLEDILTVLNEEL